MRRTALILSVIMMMTIFLPFRAGASADISINIDGTALVPKDADGNTVPPFVENGTTYVPVRAIASAFDLSIDWDSATKTVFIGQKSDKAVIHDYINIFIGGEEFIAKDSDGERVYPILRGGTTYLPIRAIGEAFGKNVIWDNFTKTAILITPLSDEERAAFSEAVQGTLLLTDHEIVTLINKRTGNTSEDEEEKYQVDIENLFAQFLTDEVLAGSAAFNGGTYYASVDIDGIDGVYADDELSRADIYVTVENGVIASEKIHFFYGEDKKEITMESVISLVDYETEEEM